MLSSLINLYHKSTQGTELRNFNVTERCVIFSGRVIFNPKKNIKRKDILQHQPNGIGLYAIHREVIHCHTTRIELTGADAIYFIVIKGLLVQQC